jgi:LysR family transcriptional regulator, nod-box dependent transcriptional activator
MLMMLDQGEFDLIITPDDHTSPDHPSELLFEERHAVADWRRNPLVKKPISEEKFFESSHVGEARLPAGAVLFGALEQRVVSA